MPKTPPPGFIMQPMPQTISQPVHITVHQPQQSATGAGYPPHHTVAGGGYPPHHTAAGGGYPPPPYSHPQQGYPGPFQAPVQQQPSQHRGHDQQYLSGWMNGNFYTYLQNATSFHVKQKVELVEAILGWETENKYTVKDQTGHKIFYVGEESNLCGRQLCNARRQFTLTVKDGAGQNIMIVDRPLDCSCCCGFFCPDKVTVTTPSGQLLGSVTEEFNLLYPTFNINDASGRPVLKIEGPMCPLSFGSCSGSVVFRIMNQHGISVGTISKEWSGFVRELFTDADYFSISFPFDLEPSVKAVCLAALFLIDYEYFEAGAINDQQGGRRLFA